MKKNTSSGVLVLLAALGFSSSLIATVDAQKQFVAAYPDAKAKLGKCTTCHTAAMPKKESSGPERLRQGPERKGLRQGEEDLRLQEGRGARQRRRRREERRRDQGRNEPGRQGLEVRSLEVESAGSSPSSWVECCSLRRPQLRRPTTTA